MGISTAEGTGCGKRVRTAAGLAGAVLCVVGMVASAGWGMDRGEHGTAAADPRWKVDFRLLGAGGKDAAFRMPSSTHREWSVGLGASSPLEEMTESFLGGGLLLERSVDEAPLPGESDLPRELGLKPWLGACVDCAVGAGLHLGLEGRWAPRGVSVLGEGSGTEERVGLTLGFHW
jgi:hypothetical protein